MEEGNVRVPSGSIGWAVAAMRDGAKVRRRGWNGKGMHLFFVGSPELIRSGSHDDWQSFVAMRTSDGTNVPWLCSQTDLLMYDWELAA